MKERIWRESGKEVKGTREIESGGGWRGEERQEREVSWGGGGQETGVKSEEKHLR